MDLTKINQLPFDQDRLQTFATTYANFSQMMRHSHDKQEAEKLRLNLTALYQNHFIINKEIILLDGLNNNPPVDYHGLTVCEAICLYSYVDSNKKNSAIDLPDFNTFAPIRPTPVTNYDYIDLPTRTVICPATMRPWSICQITGLDWRLASEQYWSIPVTKQISAFRYFIDYIYEKKQHPTVDDLILYFAKRQSGKGISTLPTDARQIALDVISAYEKVGFVAEAADIDKFIQKTKDSLLLVDRRKIENQ